MLAALEESARSRRQFVADASHELRTPLTSLRTNIEVLARDESMAPDERERLLGDVVEQFEEMSVLITELVELARADQAGPVGRTSASTFSSAEAVERARRNRPGVAFELDAEESVVHGVPGRSSGRSRTCSTTRRSGARPTGRSRWPCGGELTVRDHGPGIADEDLPHVFDNFYRAPSARGMPGSGLGLAIVRRVAESNGGDVTVEPAEGGGTLVRLRLAPAR